MIEIVEATFQDGVFKPDRRLSFSESTRVRLLIEPVGDEAGRQHQSWIELERLWQKPVLDSQGDRLKRDQLHERR